MGEIDSPIAPVRTFLERSLPRERRAAMLAGDAYDSAFVAELAREGWFALTAPTDLGGLDLPMDLLGAVAQEVGELLVPGPVLENLVLPSLLASTANDQVRHAITRTIETGSPISLIDARPPLVWSAGDARPVLRGGVLDGKAQLVRFGGHASTFVVLCAGGGGQGQQVVIVDGDARGVHIEHQDSGDPLTCVAAVQFEGVGPLQAVDDPAVSNVLADRIRAWLRLLVACELAGVSRYAFRLAMSHIELRQQFGRTISSFQAVQHIAADMFALTTSLDNLCTMTIKDFADGYVNVAHAGASAKAWAAEAARQVCENSIQLHGGIGFTYELDLHWYYKHALCVAAWLGDQSELESELGRALLDVALKRSPSARQGVNAR